jgi:histone H1/5
MRNSNNGNFYNLIESDLLNNLKNKKSVKVKYPTHIDNNSLAQLYKNNNRYVEKFETVAESEQKKLIVAVPQVKSNVAVPGEDAVVKNANATAAAQSQAFAKTVAGIQPESEYIASRQQAQEVQYATSDNSYIKSEIPPSVYFINSEQEASFIPSSEAESYTIPPSLISYKKLLSSSGKEVTLINGGRWIDGSNILNNGGIYFDQDKDWTQVSGSVINLNQFDNTDKTDVLPLLQNIITNEVGNEMCENDVPCKKLLIRLVGRFGYVVFGITSVTKGSTSTATIYTNTIPDADLIEFGGSVNDNDIYSVMYSVYDSRPQIIIEEEPVEEQKPKKYKNKDLIIPLPEVKGNLTLWLDGSDPLGDTSIPDDKTPLFNWVDKSKVKRNGNTLDEYIGTDYNPPIVIQSDTTDNTIVRFDKDQNYLVTYPAFPNAAVTIFTVQKSSQSTEFSRLIHAPANSDSSLYIGIRGDNIATFTGDTTIWNDIDPNNANMSNVNNWRLLTTQIDGDSLLPYVDGTPQENKIGTMTAFDDILIGYSDTQSWIGDVAEILIFDSVLEKNDRKKIEVYLSNKWKISYNDVKEEPERIPIEVLQEQKAAKQEALIAVLSQLPPIVKIEPKVDPNVVIKIVDGVKVAVKPAAAARAAKTPVAKAADTKVVDTKVADTKAPVVAKQVVTTTDVARKQVDVTKIVTKRNTGDDSEAAKKKFQDELLQKAKEASKDIQTAARAAAVARDASIVTSRAAAAPAVTSKKKSKKKKKKSKKKKKKRKSKKKSKKPVAKFENTEHFEVEEPNFFNDITNTIFSKITEGFNLFFN